MRSLLKVQQKIVPDMLEVMQKRYQVLLSIRLAEPVGRRKLAEMLGMTERVLRSEADFLKDSGLIEIKSSGMTVTSAGKGLLAELEDMVQELSGVRELERKLQSKLGVRKVQIIPGDSDETPVVKEEMGKACADYMRECLSQENVIAVTGGTTMASAADMLEPMDGEGKGLLFVPARGGIGEDVKNQANVICATMAEKTGGSHRVLYVPDQVGREAYESLMKEPTIIEIVSMIKSANIVLHGIGDAMTMAKRRRTSEAGMKKIIEKNAVGEAFGYYFNEIGEIVHKVPTIGLQLADLHRVPCIVATAGGTSKAKAIRSYMVSAPEQTVLITDEGAARKLLEEA